MNFNLVEEEWIPVLRNDGVFERVGIWKALTEAGHIRQIAASNPLDNVALLRFLLAVLQWCKPDLSETERAQLNGAAGIPIGMLSEKLGTPGKPSRLFDLLGNDRRFMQDTPNCGKKRPIGDLLFEIPTDTNIAHFRHARDEEFALCPACCAVGIIRHSAWAPANRFYTAPVNGPSPAYSIQQEATLLMTLLGNWPSGIGEKRDPPWLNQNPPKEEELDAKTVFAWKSRKVWLGKLTTVPGACGYCGRQERLIRHVAFAGNWKPPFRSGGNAKKFWPQDPHLVLEGNGRVYPGPPKSQGARVAPKSGSGKGKQLTPLPFPEPAFKLSSHARLWRRVLRAELARRQVNGELRRLVVGVSKQDFLYQDARAIELPSISESAVESAKHTIRLIEEKAKQLLPILKESAPNPKRKHPEREAALESLSAVLEAALREHFVAGADLEALEEKFRFVLRNVLLATGTGSPLRNREAIDGVLASLRRVFRKCSSSRTKNSASDDEGLPTDSTSPERKWRGKKGEIEE